MSVEDAIELLNNVKNKKLPLSVFCKSEVDSIEIASIEEETDCVLIMEED